MSDGARTRPRFAVIGAGMAGILAAIKLREAGFDDVVVYEKADRVGGTWRENTYPGLSCDVPSHFYSIRSRSIPSGRTASRRDRRSSPTSRTSHDAWACTRSSVSVGK